MIANITKYARCPYSESRFCILKHFFSFMRFFCLNTILLELLRILTLRR